MAGQGTGTSLSLKPDKGSLAARIAVLAIPALILAGTGISQAFNFQLPEKTPVTYTQHRELLATTAVVPTSFDITRGTIGGEGYDPAPTATLEVVGRHTGGTWGSFWDVTLRDAAGLEIATVPHSYNAGQHMVRSRSFTWPAVATETGPDHRCPALDPARHPRHLRPAQGHASDRPARHDHLHRGPLPPGAGDPGHRIGRVV